MDEIIPGGSIKNDDSNGQLIINTDGLNIELPKQPKKRASMVYDGFWEDNGYFIWEGAD